MAWELTTEPGDWTTFDTQLILKWSEEMAQHYRSQGAKQLLAVSLALRDNPARYTERKTTWGVPLAAYDDGKKFGGMYDKLSGYPFVEPFFRSDKLDYADFHFYPEDALFSKMETYPQGVSVASAMVALGKNHGRPVVFSEYGLTAAVDPTAIPKVLKPDSELSDDLTKILGYAHFSDADGLIFWRIAVDHKNYGPAVAPHIKAWQDGDYNQLTAGASADQPRPTTLSWLRNYAYAFAKP